MLESSGMFPITLTAENIGAFRDALLRTRSVQAVGNSAEVSYVYFERVIDG